MQKGAINLLAELSLFEDINQVDHAGDTPLMCAIKMNNIECVYFLLQCQAKHCNTL